MKPFDVFAWLLNTLKQVSSAADAIDVSAFTSTCNPSASQSGAFLACQPTFYTSSHQICFFPKWWTFAFFFHEHFSVLLSVLCDTVPEKWWGKPAIYMSQVTVTCLSAHHFQHRGQTAQQRTELCPTALSVMLRHTAITLLLHNTGAECSPPPPPLHTHINIYTHTHLVMPPSTWTCHSTFDSRRLHVGYIIITARTCKANRSCSAPHQKPTNQQQHKKKAISAVT